MYRSVKKGIIAVVLILSIIICQVPALADAIVSEDARIVLTLGADLTADQKAEILSYFGLSENQVTTLVITNADEVAQLGGLIPLEQIGTRTISCALVKMVNSGGIQVKTANLSYVTGNMIASNLTTSGIYNCEALAAAPFAVSGTGALTGIMMAYEAASDQQLDEDMKELANEEMVVTGEISEVVGQEQATLVVNDIKIHIIRDQITEQEEVNQVVDEVIDITEDAAREVAEVQGQGTPATLGEVEHQKLYDLGYKFGQMHYNYSDMQVTLERVTRNVTRETGINDPIVDTFTTLDDDKGLSVESILMTTNDEVFEDGTIISSTNNVALGEHIPDPVDIFSNDVVLREAGGVRAENFIPTTSLVPYKDVNGSYALMDLNGNILTDSIYTKDFNGAYGNVKGIINDGSNLKGVLGADGRVLIPFELLPSLMIPLTFP